jgi:hypothetical protein
MVDVNNLKKEPRNDHLDSDHDSAHCPQCRAAFTVTRTVGFYFSACTCVKDDRRIWTSLHGCDDKDLFSSGAKMFLSPANKPFIPQIRGHARDRHDITY